MQQLAWLKEFALKHEKTAFLMLVSYFLYDLAKLYMTLTLGSPN